MSRYLKCPNPFRGQNIGGRTREDAGDEPLRKHNVIGKLRYAPISTDKQLDRAIAESSWRMWEFKQKQKQKGQR